MDVPSGWSRFSGDHVRGPFGGPGRLRNALVRFSKGCAIPSVSAKPVPEWRQYIPSAGHPRQSPWRKPPEVKQLEAAIGVLGENNIHAKSFTKPFVLLATRRSSGTGGVLQEFSRTSTQAGSPSPSSHRQCHRTEGSVRERGGRRGTQTRGSPGPGCEPTTSCSVFIGVRVAASIAHDEEASLLASRKRRAQHHNDLEHRVNRAMTRIQLGELSAGRSEPSIFTERHSRRAFRNDQRTFEAVA